MSNLFKILSAMICLLLLSGCEKEKGRIEVKKAHVNDIELAYYTRGSGEPLVMIMGFRGTMGIWDPALLDILEKKYKLILFDNRGAGLSSDTEEDHTTIAQMADDAAQLIKALGYSKVHVLGWSMGSRIAAVLASDHPEMVNTLTLCAPNPGGKYSAPRTTDTYASLTGKSLSREEGLSLIFPNTVEGKKAASALVERITKGIMEGRIPDDIEVKEETVERQTNALKLWQEDSNAYALFSKIKIPTLVAGGLADTIDSPKNVRTVACTIPFAWSAYFPGTGHDFLSQDYQAFGNLLMLFIETNKS